jgi:uncharacterized protein with HEPN domain
MRLERSTSFRKPCMSRSGDLARLELILNYASDIDEIVERHGGVSGTLRDKEGRYAVLLCLAQIGELLSRIETQAYIESLPIRFARGLRNIIVHDYEGVDLTIVEGTLETSVPELTRSIESILYGHRDR